MENKILLKAGIKRHKGTLAGIFILTFLAAAALGTVITIWFNSCLLYTSPSPRDM